MTGALFCLANFFWLASVNARVHIELPKIQYLSTAEVQHLITNSKGRDVQLSVTQLKNGYRHLNGEWRESGTEYVFHAPAENSTLALLAEKGISYKARLENRDFTLGLRAALWVLGSWGVHLLMPVFCFFIVVAGAATLLRRRDHPPSEPRSIAAARNERRVDKAFAALAACGMVAVAVLLGLTTDWKVRRLAADQLPGILAQHKKARFEVFEYRDGSRKLWISDLRAPDFIAPVDESTLLGPPGAPPRRPRSGRPGLYQSTSVLAILTLAAAAGSLWWWAAKSRSMS